AHVIDVLRGADTAKVRQSGHETLSTYGIGSDLDAKQWRSVFRQLVAAGLLDVDIEGHGALRLNAASTPLLKGERTLSLRAEPPARARKRERGKRDAVPSVELPAAAAERFESLRAWRAGSAREQNVPAYVIFHDSTLRAIALAQPDGLDALAGISGVGAGKLERYGREVLEALERATA
ncbi:MAG: HRDC domain-containing protein, partial [bacterium]|nr:HRDC domain-containing protein [bacterium]